MGVEDDIKEEILKQEDKAKSDIAQTSELLLNDQFRRRKTILRERKVAVLSTLETIAELYDIEFLKQWIEAYTEYITSVDGRGRQDIVDIVKFNIERENQRQTDLLNILGRR